MPLRPFSRDLAWLLPPHLDEWIPTDHPARFVAAVVDALDPAVWAELGAALSAEPLGAPAYHPRVLLCVWLYGFMTGTRSCRKLEAACRDQMPYLWLTGCQHPDHNTLWRFYQTHRSHLRSLFKRTVRTAVHLGLVDLTVQALDGTKIAANAARGRTYDAKGLRRVLARTEEMIADLEAQNRTGGDPVPPRLPQNLQKAQELREQVRTALALVEAEDGPARVNLTDGDSAVVQGRTGTIQGYNAQAAVVGLNSKVTGRTGLLITAEDVVNDPDDHAQLLPMLEQAASVSGQKAAVNLVDGGYHSGPNLADCQERGYAVLMPEAQAVELEKPYHKDRFVYDALTDSYTCPQGQTLRFSGITERSDRPAARVYRSTGAVCRACPAFGQCTREKRQGRSLEIGPHDARLRTHRTTMATQAAQDVYRLRKQLVEPGFGILKDVHGARRFLLRGLTNVRAEWTLLTTSFNLRTLAGVWRRWSRAERTALVASLAG